MRRLVTHRVQTEQPQDGPIESSPALSPIHLIDYRTTFLNQSNLGSVVANQLGGLSLRKKPDSNEGSLYSQKRLIAGLPKSTVVALVSTEGLTQDALLNGRAIYCERSEGQQIFKLTTRIIGTPVATFTVRNSLGALLNYPNQVPLSTSSDLHLLAFITSSSSSRTIYADGNTETNTTDVEISYTEANDVRIGTDSQDTETAFNGGIYYVALFDRDLSVAELNRLYSDPWSIYAPKSNVIYFDFGGSPGVVTLTGSHATQTNTSTTGAIAQTHVLTSANATQSNASSTGAISQPHVLTGTNSTQTNTSTTGAIAQTHVLTSANATQSNASTTGAIGQTHVLSGANATQVNNSSTGAISTDGTVILTGANATQTNSSSTGAITQTHVLTGISSTQVNNSSIGAIIVAGTIVLTGAHATQSNSSSTGAIAQTHVLTGANATQGNSSSTGAIGFPGQLTPSVHESHVKTYADAEAVTLLADHEPITILAITDTIRTYQ
jgi:hypothetical protein